MPDLEFAAVGESHSPARVEVAARGFRLIVDEPPALGGEDRGPNPVEYNLAGLIGCLNVMGHLVAREQGIVLRSLRIEARGPINPAKLFGQPTDDRPGYKRIDVRLQVDSDASDEALARWLRTVESRCPVSDNLGNATPVALGFARAA